MISTYLRVFGDPAPQGSKRHVGNGVLVESSARVKPWRAAVVAAAADCRDSWAVPVVLTAFFQVPRPKSHFRGGGLRASAPAWPVSRRVGDLDKLIRATLDGLVDAGVLADDSLVVDIRSIKSYSGPDDQPGAFLYLSAADA